MARSSLIPNANRFTRSAVFGKNASAPAKDAAADKVVERKSGKVAIPAKKAPRFYPAEDVRKPTTTRKTPGSVPLRVSITPGTVLILLAGRYRGKRVVFLKQLESGLLLVTGPAKLNGVPARRVNQAYVIATSTKIDVSSVKVDHYNDAYFAKPAKAKKQEFLESQQTKKVLPESRIADQKALDKEVLAAIGKTPFVASYLKSTFGLSKGQFPHNMKF